MNDDLAERRKELRMRSRGLQGHGVPDATASEAAMLPDVTEIADAFRALMVGKTA